ncbi:hypothetical protein BBJ29_000157 [Phytophthora kernoviae]|uniref:RING-type domain-containing protein n=1 Tax=Phytophthora kernoviae TaxID=325452 RepID=A0A3F2RBL3_9STRA|nr:hypothetical protein BBP00_00009805 [Phytophthora kernoviae]RLN58932.1 hypothetical protein BBJ29_000157 [Phytophthora kernoviae]
MTMKSSNSLKRAAPLALPESVAWMEHLDLDMNTAANKKLSLVKRNNTLYELQRRLVKTLRPGHKCNAECRWLVNVVKNHFPKASLFCKNCPATVESRRLALQRMLKTIKASLVNHGNVGCSILRDEVSKEFATFVAGSCKDVAVLKHTYSTSTTATDSRSETTEDDLTASVVSFTSDEENQVLGFEFDEDFSAFECGLCGCTLDTEETMACDSLYCTTTAFECDHQFHDACLLSVLDEEARCPLCE